MIRNSLRVSHIFFKSATRRVRLGLNVLPQRNFTVYKKGDISNDLLITLSMNQDSRIFQSHEELVENLVKKNFLKTTESIDSFKLLDRAMFNTFHMADEETAYLDRPYSIGNNEKMTSPMMHAIAIDVLTEPIKQIMNDTSRDRAEFLDVGTGSGYMAFLLHNVANTSAGSEKKQLTIRGIDIHDTFFEILKKIESMLQRSKKLVQRENTNVEFSKADFLKMLSTPEEQSRYDIIHVGAGLSRDQYNAAKGLLSGNNAALLAPVIEDDGEQTLYLFVRENGKETEDNIMKVVFAPLKDLTQMERVNKFFFTQDEALDEDSDGTQDKDTKQTGEGSFLSFDQLKLVKQDDSLPSLESRAKTLEDNVLQWRNDFTEKIGKKPALKDMQDDPALTETLTQLRELKRKITILKRVETQAKSK